MTHLHHVGRRRGGARRPGRGAARLARRRAGDRRRSSSWATSTPTRRADLRADARAPASVRVRGGQRRRAGRDLAVRPPGAGDGHGRRPGLPRLHLGPRRGPGRRRAGSPSTGPPPTTRRSIPATTSGSPPSSRSARGAVAGRTLRLAHRGDWRRAPENTIAALLAAHGDRRAATGVEFDVRAVGRRRSGPRPRRDARPGPGRPEPVDDLTAAALGGLGVPRSRTSLAAAAAARVPRRRAQGPPRPRGHRGPGRRARSGARERGRLVVRSRDAASGSAGLAPAGRAGSTRTT